MLHVDVHQGGRIAAGAVAYLDSGADLSLVTEDFVRRHKLKTRAHHAIDIATVGQQIVTNRAVNLSLSAPGRHPVRKLVAAVAEFDLAPIRRWRHPEQRFPSLQKYQEGVNTVDVEDGEQARVDILIGIDHLYTLLGSEMIRPSEKLGTGFALLQTPFGLVPTGTILGEKSARQLLYHVAAVMPRATENIEEHTHYATFRMGRAIWPWSGRPDRTLGDPKELDVPGKAYIDLEKLLKQFFSLESISVLDAATNPRTRSQEAYLSTVKSTLKRHPDGSYETSLVFNPQHLDAPCNYAHVRGHANRIYRELLNENAKEAYDQAIQKLVSQGFATLEPDQGEEIARKNKEMFTGLNPVLKHNPVTGETKVRLVLACAMKYDGVSTNSRLLDPPPLEADLFPILMGVRKYRHVLCRDLASFFPTLRLPPSQHNFSCCLIKDGEGRYRKLKWSALWFGWSASPALAMIILRIHIMHSTYPRPTLQETLDRINPKEDTEMLFGARPKVLATDNEVQRIGKDYVASLFVDDAIQSFKETEDLIRSFEVMEGILNDAHYKTSKIFTNNDDARLCIPKEQQLLDAKGEIPSATSLLGVPWKVVQDLLSPIFKINHDLGLHREGARITKRDAAIIMGSAYDPLQIGAPFTLEAKLILQAAHKEFQALVEANPELNKKSIKQQWNQPLSASLTERAKKYLLEAEKLNELTVPRWLGFEDGAQVEFYLAVDASVHSLGATVHLKIKKHGLEDRLVFVAAKSKTFEGSTIPRAEITACEMGSRLLTKVVEYLDVEDPVIFACTDATVALAWIHTEEAKLLQYVYNRVVKIKKMIPPHRWSHIDGVRNPADFATKPLSMKQLLHGEEGENWRRPSAYLEEGLLKPGVIITDSSEDFYKELARKEPKIVAGVSTRGMVKRQTQAKWAFTDLWATTMSRNSDFRQVLKKMALLMRWYRPYKMAQQRGTKIERLPHPKGPTEGEIRESLLEYVRRAQNSAFSKEIARLKRGQPVDKSSNIAQLMPFIDKLGVLRADGRVRAEKDNDYAARPMILQKGDPLARRIIDDLHRRHDHKGEHHLLLLLRKNFWVIQARRLVASVIKQCVSCQRRRGKLYQQRLGLTRPESIPEDMATDKPRLRLWKAISIDTLGSYTYLDVSNKPRKCYILIIVEMMSRYVKLVMLDNLTSRAMYVALETHAAATRKPEIILCDSFSSFMMLDKFHLKVSQHLRKELRELLEAEGIRMGVLREEGMGDNQNITYTIDSKVIFSAPSAHQISVESMVALVKRGVGLSFGKTPMRREDFVLRLQLAEKHVNSRPLVTQDRTNQQLGLRLLTPALLHHHTDDETITPYVTELRLKGTHHKELAELYNEIRKDRDDFAQSFVNEYLRHMIKTKVWREAGPSIEVGDLVLVKPENQLLKRHEWRMALVEKVYPSDRDGLVRDVDLKLALGRTKKRSVRQLVLLKRARDLKPLSTDDTVDGGEKFPDRAPRDGSAPEGTSSS